MKQYIPVLIVVLSNTFYHICAKSIPEKADTFASLSITYAVGAVASVLLLFITHRGENLLTQYGQLNWSSFVLGLAIVGLEAGFILMYKVGWSVSTGQIVQSAILAIVLIFVGFLLYGEPLSAKKILGIVICMAGMYLINS